MVQDINVSSVDQFDDFNRDLGWDIEYRQLHRGSFRARMWASDAPGALVSREEVTGPLEVWLAEPEDSVALFMPVSPLGQLHFNGYLANGRRAFLVSAGAEIDLLVSADIVCHVVRVPWSQFESIAVALGLETPLQRAETRPVDLPEHQFCGIQTAVDEVLSIDQQVPGGVGSNLVHLVESMVQPFLTRDGGREERRSDLMALRRVVEFIDANVRSEFSLVDLCEAAHLQRRSLERMFRKEFGVSPMQYVLARRMNVVRRQLLASDPYETSVSRVAQDCGFTHLGRFSGEYRKFFSELPSETLRV